MITSRNSSREDTYHIIKTYRPTFEQNLTRETADDREPHLKGKNLRSYKIVIIILIVLTIILTSFE